MATDAVNSRLKESFYDEPKQMLQPISGYEDEPLLSLEDACKPLEIIIDKELERNIMIAKRNTNEPEDGLSPDESASIHLYTMEWKKRENSLYAVLNRTLRMVDRRKLQPWFRYLKLFLTAYYKLPSTGQRSVWRGVPKDLTSDFPTGKEVIWWGLTSCTTSISVLESSAYLGTSGIRTMFSIETSSGKAIRAHSYFQQENEILLPPGICLKVVDKLSSSDGLCIIHLQEISPPYKTLSDPFDLSELKSTLPKSEPPSYVPSSQKKDERHRSASVVRKESAQVAFGRREPQRVNVETSPYSNEKLDRNYSCLRYRKTIYTGSSSVNGMKSS